MISVRSLIDTFEAKVRPDDDSNVSITQDVEAMVENLSVYHALESLIMAYSTK